MHTPQSRKMMTGEATGIVEIDPSGKLKAFVRFSFHRSRQFDLDSTFLIGKSAFNPGREPRLILECFGLDGNAIHVDEGIEWGTVIGNQIDGRASWVRGLGLVCQMTSRRRRPSRFSRASAVATSSLHESPVRAPRYLSLAMDQLRGHKVRSE